MRTSKARTGLRTRLACHRRWSVYGNFAVTHPRWEPYAGKPHVRFCAGGAMKIASLPLRRRPHSSPCSAARPWPLAAWAQPSASTFCIGFRGDGDGEYARFVDALRAGLRRLGYEEGKNIVIEFRWAEGNISIRPFRTCSRSRRRLNVDVFVARHASALAAKQATSTISIVIIVGDPVAGGVVASIARPGGIFLVWLSFC